MTDDAANPLERCQVHDMQNCAYCHPLPASYRRGPGLDVPADAYVSVRGGKGVYHYPDCYNVTGDWDGAEHAALGERRIHTSAELTAGDLRPAECCQPPLLGR